MAQGYNYFLQRVLQPVSSDQGESGYFSTPRESLDPALFSGERIHSEVRQWVLDTLYAFWDRKYSNARAWSTAWVAGSAISYQYAEARGNGDLDILIGVYWPKFFRFNERFLGLSESDMAAIMNREFHDELWPQTAQQSINGQVFEVTFYVNPGSTDIRDIRPYAAYDLTHDRWTVHPPMGDDFNHPDEYYRHAETEVTAARQIVEEYNQAAEAAQHLQPGTPGWHNQMQVLHTTVQKASEFFDQIHAGRKQAFGPSGSGYGDYNNFRWQYHKKSGTAQALNAIRRAHQEAREGFNTSLYGFSIDGADVALRRAALWNRGGNGRF